MAPKSKKQDAPEIVAEPAAKKPKAEEEPKEEEKPKFEEADAAKDNRPVVKESIAFASDETTLNVIPTMQGKLLTSLSDGGMAYLIAGARANVGQKSGRYMFEVKITHSLQTGHPGPQRPKPLIRVGFSTSSSSLLFGEDSESICFDGEGYFMSERTKRVHAANHGAAQRFGREQIVAVVLNLDAKSPNCNTIALYRDGALISEPKALPEELKGKPLFPHVCYRNVGAYVNFGPSALKELPFKCRLLQGAASSDVTVTAAQAPKDGKFEVVFPVAFPDEGTFDWLDTYLEKNPKHVELSDRKIIEWARSSGLWSKGGKPSSNDKPAFNYGIPALDDFSVRRLISTVAPLVPRNYVVMEVKSNLISNDRKDLLKKFNYPCYKKVAQVVMGTPSGDFKALVHSKILKDKQAKSDSDWKTKQAALKRQREMEALRKAKETELKKQKEKKEKDAADRLAKAKAEAAEKKAKAEAAKAAKEEAEKAAKGDAKEDAAKEGEATDAKKEAKDEEVKTEVKEEAKEEPKDEAMVETKEEEAKEEDDMETDPPAAELNEEEKAINYTHHAQPDLMAAVMIANYTKFSTPDDDEGFDAIRYEWDKGEAAKDYLKSWVLNKKLTTRLDDLRPGKEFTDKLAEFEKFQKECQAKLTTFSAGRAQPAKKKDEDDETPDVDIYTVTDICDVGDGVPLFEHFVYEDWELTQLRFELCCLVRSFRKDTDDVDRVGIPLEHFGFYYSRYFAKPLDHKRFGLADMSAIFHLVKDVVSVKDKLVLTEKDTDSVDLFLKLSEAHRRERQRRIDAGDETARVKFLPPPKKVERKPEAPKQDGGAFGKDQSKGGNDKGGKGKSWGKEVKGWGGKESKDTKDVVVKGWGGDKGEAKAQGKGQDFAAADKGERKGWGKDSKGDTKAWGKDKETSAPPPPPPMDGDKGWGKGKPAEKGFGKSEDRGWGGQSEQSSDAKGDNKGKAGEKSFGKSGDKGWGGQNVEQDDADEWGPSPKIAAPRSRSDDYDNGAAQGADKGWVDYNAPAKGADKGWGGRSNDYDSAPAKGADKGWGGKSQDRSYGNSDDKGASKGGWEDRSHGNSDDKGASKGGWEDRSHGNSDDKGASKGGWGKGDDKGFGKGADKGADKGWGKQDAGKGPEKGAEKGWGKPDAGKGGDKGFGKPDDKGFGKGGSKDSDKGWGKSDEKGFGKADDKGKGKSDQAKGQDKSWGKPDQGKGQDKGFGKADQGKGYDKGFGKADQGKDKSWGPYAP